MTIQFILNRQQISTDQEPTSSLLDFLRRDLGLTATKAGCREGDCGACSVLLGEPVENGCVGYRSVNSCLLPLGALQGRHLVTLEGLNPPPGAKPPFTPVQQAILTQGASQCGFCTPGIIISLVNLLLNGIDFSREEILEALGGNLCRCTGYMGIKRAAARVAEMGRHLPPRGQRMPALIEAGVLPEYLASIPERMAALPHRPTPDHPPLGALLVAGGTDWFLQQRAGSDRNNLWFLGDQPGLKGIEVVEDRCHIGAATTLEELLESTELAAELPHLHEFLSHVGATQVRDRATIGGNLVNASPIGDLSVCLLALEAKVLLQGPAGQRQLPLSGFFLGYKQLALHPEEWLAAVEFPLGPRPHYYNFEKVAHREHLDIAAVNSALSLQLDGDRIRHAKLTAGGVAPVPLLLSETSAWLTGRRLTPETVLETAQRATTEPKPIADIRGSVGYKRRLLHQLVIAHFLALVPERLPASFPESTT